MKAFALLIGVCVLCMSGCVNLTEADEKCGPEQHWFSNLKIVNIEKLGNLRKIVLLSGPEPEDICTVEHVKPTFLVLAYADNPIPDDIHFTASTSVPGYTPRTSDMQRTTDGDYKGEIEIGLAQAYKDKPGTIIMQIIVEFQSKGDFEADSTYLAKSFLTATATLDYREHKAL